MFKFAVLFERTLSCVPKVSTNSSWNLFVHNLFALCFAVVKTTDTLKHGVSPTGKSEETFLRIQSAVVGHILNVDLCRAI